MDQSSTGFRFDRLLVESATTLFRVPQCKDFGEASFHEDDYNIDCTTTKFMLIKAFAFFVILLIPIGVPAVFAFLMMRAKRSLGGVVNETAAGGAKLSADDVDEESDAYAFLTDDYRPECYYYEIVTYSKKLVLGGVSVMVGRGTMAQTYFVIAAEVFYLMHHMRTFPFVDHKHNVIEALGHQALILMYAIVLILRNDHENAWAGEWFPREGYGWFICFLSVVVLPSPTVYFYYKESHSVTGTRWTNASSTKNPVEADDSFSQENPLAMDVAIEVDSDPSDTTQLSRTQVAKRQREAKNMRAQVQQQQTQIRQLQTQNRQMQAENTSLKAITTAKDESTKVQALQAETAALKVRLAQKVQTDGTQLAILSDEGQSTETQQQATEKSSEAAMKELATDDTLSEETRESAKQALDELAAAQIMKSKNVAMKSKNVAHGGKTTALDMTKWLQGHRLLHYADEIIRVVGM